ncbi:hypothetical protein MKY59_21565 [Paenibacillus sp. FSL W8-0426]|uniref:hypothetical protein n=1 Tax=Paenibacillus sp. FSL W8-0426 TaxID=2921714 RepID=UPI0030DCC310
MDVLNTYGGGPELAAVILGIIFGCFVFYGVYLICEAVAADEPILVVLGVLVTLACVIMSATLVSMEAPVRHEVTVRQGHVLDAAKYEVIEQRGEIYVIEEREVSE